MLNVRNSNNNDNNCRAFVSFVSSQSGIQFRRNDPRLQHLLSVPCYRVICCHRSICAITAQGTRRFHHWEPFGTPVSYELSAHAQHDIPVVTSVSDSNNYYSYGYSPGSNEATHAHWAANQQVTACNWGYDHAELYPRSEVVNGATFPDDVHGNWWQSGWPESRGPQQGSAESDQAWQDPSLSSVDAYGGAASYDVPDGSYPAWTSEPTVFNGPPGQSVNECGAGGQEEWTVPNQSYQWTERSPETSAYYYGHDDSVLHASTIDQGLIRDNWNAGETSTGLGSWTTPETPADNVDDAYCSTLITNGSGGNGNGSRHAVCFDEDLSSWQTSGKSWYYNEYGQRVCGDWVEYFDESAQATYFYNAATGEVRK